MDNTNGASGIFDIETIDVAGRLLRIGRRSGQKGIISHRSCCSTAQTLSFWSRSWRSWTIRNHFRRAWYWRLSQSPLALPVLVFGISWGGAAALQFAHDFPNRCRRLVLAATSPGALMVPGKIGAIVNDFLRRVGANLYGGVFRKSPELLSDHVRHIKPPGGIGYAYQVLAGAGWTSLPWLHRLRQPALIIHGTDDPIVPLTNAKILASLIPRSTLRVIDDGHLFPLTRANAVAPMISKFLLES